MLSTASQTHNSIWTSAVSLPKIFPPIINPLKFLVHAPVHRPSSKHHPIQENDRVLPIPGRKRHRINSKTARKTRKTNPTSKVTRTTSTSRTQTQICRLSTLTVDRVDNLPPLSPPVLAWTKERRKTRRKAINACYQSAALPTPSSPSNSHGLGLAIHPKQGPVSLKWRWSMGSGE